MFRLHGNGRDQTRPHLNRTVSRPTRVLVQMVFEGFPRGLLKHEYVRYLLEIQVQEAHRLQEEETAAPNKETTLSPPSPDVTQGQLSRSTP